MPDTKQGKSRHCNPTFILLRAGCRAGPRIDHRHALDVIAHSNIPTLNSIDSFVASQDKAVLYGRLLRVKHRLNARGDTFPLVSQACYSDWRAASFPPDTPLVAKVGTASGGLGKMKVNSSAEWEDFCSVMQMQSDFFTSEPFVSWTYDIRVQKIGNHYRCFRRSAKHWKANVDIAMQDEDIAVEPRYKLWIDEAARELGMDICALDVLQVRDEDDSSIILSEHILELNSSAIGFNGRHMDADAAILRELVLRKMKEQISPQPSSKEKKSKSKGKDATANQSYVESLESKVLDLEKEIDFLRQQLLQAASPSPNKALESDKKIDNKKKKKKKI